MTMFDKSCAQVDITFTQFRHKDDAHYGQGVHRGKDLYEVGGFIVHFFDRPKVEALTDGYELINIHEFEEGGLPRKLYLVTLEKNRVE